MELTGPNDHRAACLVAGLMPGLVFGAAGLLATEVIELRRMAPATRSSGSQRADPRQNALTR